MDTDRIILETREDVGKMNAKLDNIADDIKQIRNDLREDCNRITALENKTSWYDGAIKVLAMLVLPIYGALAKLLIK